MCRVPAQPAGGLALYAASSPARARDSRAPRPCRTAARSAALRLRAATRPLRHPAPRAELRSLAVRDRRLATAVRSALADAGAAPSRTVTEARGSAKTAPPRRCMADAPAPTWAQIRTRIRPQLPRFHRSTLAVSSVFEWHLYHTHFRI